MVHEDSSSNAAGHPLPDDRAGEVMDAQSRFRRLLEANRSIIGELDLVVVLRRIVEAARELVGARYAALGVIGSDDLLEQFIHVGLDVETVAAIGELPKGRGLLGALIEDPRPILISNIAEDERSAGFPPGHPPMTGFLGVPIQSRNQVYGNLYLTDRREGGSFTQEDEDLVLALAATAGVAIENARLYAISRRRQEWSQASAEITTTLLSSRGSTDPLQMIVDSVRRLADADVVTLVVPSDQADMLEVTVASGQGGAQFTGMQYRATNSLVALAMETGRGVRIGSVSSQPAVPVHLTQIVDVGAVMAVPLTGKTGPQGAITVGRLRGRHAFASADLEMAEAFASQAAVARELVEARADQQRLAVLEDRDRIARDLHDHVIQRLFAAGLTVQSMAALTTNGAAAERLARVVADIDDTIRQIRTSIFHLQTNAAQAPGTRSAVLQVVAQITPMFGFEPTVRFSGPVDTMVPGSMVGDIEAVVREAMTNTARHARATELGVEVAVDGHSLKIVVADDGVGVGTPCRMSGLKNLGRRAEELGGGLTIDSTPNEGTRLTWTTPLPQ